MKRLLIILFVSFMLLNISNNPFQFSKSNLNDKFSNEIAWAASEDNMNMDNMENMDDMDTTDNMDNMDTTDNMDNMDKFETSSDHDDKKEVHAESTEGHSEVGKGHGQEAANAEGPNLIFLVMLGNIIVLSIVIAAAIKFRRGRVNDGTSN